MEITSENFEAQFGLIEKSILEADFVAIDTEFSGNFPNHTSSLPLLMSELTIREKFKPPEWW